ncbi:hypothetical protein BYT27DRAFT_7125254 [Phlegmacium glaucopus]|nr:hypothetical protein BYT27DRAFT_7125254 [Phlegmacium glaucopus]
MASAPLLIVVDDKRTDSIFFGPKDWNTSTLTPWFNGTEQVPSFASKGSNQFGTIFMKFQGTSVAFFGITPSAFNGSQILSVSIDGSQPTNTSYDDPNPPSYRQWYQSPTLPQGSHQISLGHLAGTSLDFAVVAVGQDTPLAGQLAIVDNEDPAFTFKGNWKQNKALFNSGQFPDGLPFHNSTQDSSTIGDQLTFRFTGTGQSAAIYGIFNWSNLGLITLTFTMDGSSLSRTFRVTTTTPQFQSRLGQQQNFQFFSYDFLSPGNHTLVVNVTDRVNQTFSFDYITFTPSFATLATRPNLTSLTDTASGDLSSSQSKLSPGAIAGIVISLIVVLLLGGVFFLRRRRLRKKTSEYNLSKPPFVPYHPILKTQLIYFYSQPVPPKTA